VLIGLIAVACWFCWFAVAVRSV